MARELTAILPVIGVFSDIKTCWLGPQKAAHAVLGEVNLPLGGLYMIGPASLRIDRVHSCFCRCLSGMAIYSSTFSIIHKKNAMD